MKKGREFAHGGAKTQGRLAEARLTLGSNTQHRWCWCVAARCGVVKDHVIRPRCFGVLRTTARLSIAEVAERAGFSSGEYLCVAFKKQKWPSPKMFRVQVKGGGGRALAQ